MMNERWLPRKWTMRLLAAVAMPLVVVATTVAQQPVGEELVGKFKQACAQRAAEADKSDTMTVVGRDGWLFLGKELRHLSVGKFWGPDAAKVSRATKPDQADPLPAILDFQAQLKQAGIELLLVPAPPKAIIFPDKICDAVQAGDAPPPRLDLELQAFYKLLGEKGVTVLDLTQEFLDHRADNDVPLYCRQDSHWSGAACELAAQRIARSIEQQKFAGEKKRELDAETRKIEISGDLWQALAGSKPPAETIALRFVGSPSATTPVEPERTSPVVLLGDSHNLVFHSGGDMHAKGAGLPDQLTHEWGFPVDLMAVRGSGATPARINLLRQARANPKYLAGKKLIVWCFAAREFTEAAGWQKVPVVK
jgi:alginate O-acetyltransferase complex protein AlgJ